MTYSVSAAQMFMRCPRSWSYLYTDDITVRHPAVELTIGALCHVGMEHAMREIAKGNSLYVAAKRGLVAMSEHYREAYETFDEELLRHAQETFQLALIGFKVDKYDVLHIDGEPCLEMEFEVPFPRGEDDLAFDTVHGFIDAILVERETGDIYVVDYKFRKRFTGEEDELTNIQNYIYAYACMQMGIEVHGTMVWQCKSVAMAEPAMLRNGRVSKAKINMTWEMYMRFVISKGLDPHDYLDMKAKLEEVEWSRVCKEIITPIAIDNVMKDVFMPVVRSMKAGVQRRCMYAWNCRSCQYRNLCMAEVRGYDYESMIDTEDSEYIRRSTSENDSIVNVRETEGEGTEASDKGQSEVQEGRESDT